MTLKQVAWQSIVAQFNVVLVVFVRLLVKQILLRTFLNVIAEKGVARVVLGLILRDVHSRLFL